MGKDMELFDEGDRVELLTRMLVRGRFMNAVKGRLEASVLAELERVLFEVAYPTPPSR
jgi:predicted methyltransferase MtxX (methanogen marker protein 4)